MPEYIEKEAALQEIHELMEMFHHARTILECLRFVEGALNGLPAADVAPVMRCKGCTYLLRDNSAAACHLCMRRQHFPQEVNLDDFCSFGERWNDNA